MDQSYSFWETVICGFIATFAMSMVSFLLGSIGLPVIDVGYILKEIFNHVHEHQLYTIVWGNAAYYLGGILLALLWVVFLQFRMPGNWFVKGVIYGIIISVVAGLIISPIVSMAGGESFGIFYSGTWYPVLITLGGLIMHLAYGISLLLCLEYAEVFRAKQSV